MASDSEDEVERELWDDAGFVASSTYRLAVFDNIGVDSPNTPSNIAEASGKDISHISRALSDLKEHALVDILNPDARKGRLYALTERAADVEAKVDQLESDT